MVNGTVILTNVNLGTFTFTPTVPPPAQGSFFYQVTDSNVPPCTSNPTQVIIDIEEGPQAMPATFTGCVNTPVTGSLVPFASGGLPPYMFFFTGALPPCALSVNIATDGDFTFVPATGFSGPCTFNYEVDDSTPCASDSTVTVDVEQGPIASNSGPFAACEFDAFSGNLNNFVTGGTPPYSFTGDNAINGTLDLSVTGPFTFTPASIGFASFDYSAFSAFGCHGNTATISFIAAESPVLVGPSPLNTCQRTPITSTVTATGSAGIQPFTFSIVATTNGTAVINSVIANTATFTFTPTVTVFPTPTVVGSVTIRASASNGCFDDFTVIINIHQNPIALSTGIGSCSPLFTGNLNNYVTGGVPPYIFAQVGTVNPPGCGSVVISPLGPFIFTAGGTGPCTFVYQVTENSVSHCTATGAITITTSIPPVAHNGSFCNCFNVPFTFNLNSLVTGGVPPYTFVIVGTPVGGTVFLNPITGIVTFRPFPGFTGIGSFQFQAFDSFNPPCGSNVATVTIQIPCCPSGVLG